ncbi:MAG: hypothetical protein ABI836_11500 [Gemmatimonadota bacterium]
MKPSSTIAVLLFPIALASCSDATGPSPKPSLSTLALGTNTACRVQAGSIGCWGRGVEGQLGIGLALPDTTPAVIPGAPALTSLAGGSTHMCGLEANGAAWCWGSDLMDELGSSVTDEQCGSTTCQTTPVLAATGLRFRELALGNNFTCGLATDGKVYCWGLNDTGQLGNASTGTSCGGLRCSADPVVAAGGKQFSAITAGLSHICALDRDGVAWCWGYEALPIPNGHPNPSFLPNPRRVTGAPPLIRINAGGYHTCALTESGAAWCWGIDALGAGPSPLESAKPVLVDGGHDFVEIASARFTSCGRDRSGAVFCWGPNTSGEVGNQPVGSTSRFDSPARISGSFLFRSLAPGGSTYCGITDAGETVCWGRGVEGELGSGHANSTVPIVVDDG